MKTLKDFTPEIKAKIPDYIKRYTSGVFDGGRYNSFTRESAEALIHWNYEKCGYKNPVVLVAENPYEMQAMFNWIKSQNDIWPLIYLLFCQKNGIRSQLDSQLRSQIYSQLGSQLDSQLGSQLDSQLYSQLYSQLGSQLSSQLDSQLYSQLDSQLGSQLDSQLYSQLRSQLGSQLDSQLSSQLRSQLDSQLYSQLDSQLGSQLDSQLSSQLRSQLDSQLDSQLYSQLSSQLDSQLDSQLGYYNNMYLWTANVYSNCTAAWFKFIKDEFKIDAQVSVVLDSWNDLYDKSGVYSAIFSELLCIVSKYPKRVHRNENNDLHNLNGPAVEWGCATDHTNFNRYYINGRNIPKSTFDLCLSGSVSKEDFTNESNEEIKAAIYEILGQENIMRLLGAYQVDKDCFIHLNGQTEEITLYKTRETFSETGGLPLAWVRFICPSTGTNYLIDVEPKWNTAKEAAVSTSPLFHTVEEYSFTDRA